MTTVEEVRPAPVQLGRRRGGPDVKTSRTDRWWIPPATTAITLLAFVAYSTWVAFQNSHYYAAPYISPFYSPCVSSNCVYQQLPIVGTWWKLSPALIILWFPLGFRLTCYYYRKAYYRSFLRAPVACAVKDARPRYRGETRFPLILQNAHRWFFYAGVVFNVFLTIDAVRAYDFPHTGWGMGLGSLVLTVNAVLLWLYSMSCHSCRHLAGGRLNHFAQHPIRHWIWKKLTPLNAHHMRFAWASLVFVALTDVYVRLVASGLVHDPRFF